MRLLLASLFVFVAVSADAQTQFVQACVASAASQETLDIDPAAVCGCAASRSLADEAVTAASLDQFGVYLSGVADEPPSSEIVPEEMEAVAGIAIQALSSCVADGGYGSALERALKGGGTVPANETEPATGEEGGGAVAPVAPTRPSGLRTGDGKAPVQAVRSGPGAPIRIVGAVRPEATQKR